MSSATSLDDRAPAPASPHDERWDLSTFFSQTIDGCFFMLLDEPVRWDDATDKEQALDYIFAHQRITRVNDAMLAQYGVAREAMLHQTPTDLFRHNLAHGRDLWRQMLDAGKIRLESDERKSDGTPMWIEGEYIVLYDAAGRVAGHFGIQRDITERKQSEQSLRLFRSLIDRVNDTIEIIDPETGRFLDVNECACRTHGMSREEYLSLSVPQIDPLVGQQPWPEVLASIRGCDALVLQTQHRKKDGSVFPVEVNCSSVHLGREYILAVVRDISERVRAQEALRASDQRLHMALRAASVGLWDWDIVTGEVLYSTDWKRQLGYRDDEIENRYEEWDSRLHDDDRQRVSAGLKNYLEGHAESYAVEFRLRHKDGSYRWIFTRGEALRDEHGKAVRMLGCHVDITERKCVEAALRESEQRYKAIFQNAPDALFVIAADGDDIGRIVAANEQAARMRHTSVGEIVDRKIQEFDTPDAAAQAPDRLRRIVAGERLTFEVEHRLPDGSEIPVEVTAGRIMLDGRPHVLAFDRDISDRRRAERAEAERRKLEAQILHAQKLESLGVLAGGIAHDFNNLMTVVLGYANLALMKLPEESPVRQMLHEIEKGAQRATELTQQMLAYAGKGNFVIQSLQLDTLVHEMHSLLQTAVSKKALVQLQLQPATIEGDATQIRQVVMNLITNASDALGDGEGIIRIATGVRSADVDDLRSRYAPEALPAGTYAFVQIADTGCGMSEETLSRIFDPFFTTKFTGRGLGLAGVLGIVRSHRGTVKVESSPGRGAMFEVLLPSSASSSRIAASAESRVAPRGQGTVLVIDDEPGVSSFAQAALETVGFRVMTSVDGPQALALFERHRGEIKAVLLDLTMPRMDGEELLSRLQSQAPHIPVLVMSGFDQQEFARRFTGRGASGFIQKPFHPRELIERMTALTTPAM
jgi:PAS domain S-box-containing protein